MLIGGQAGRGPDNEPLVRQREALAMIDDSVLREAKALYHEAFAAGRTSTSPS